MAASRPSAVGDPETPTETRGAVEIFSTRDALTEAAALGFVSLAGEAIRASGRFVVALSGGSTPKSLYTRLATEPLASRVDWERVQLCWGDERCVAPDDPGSNYRMVRETLLDRIPIPVPNVHRIRGEDDPAGAAADYESELRRVFATPSGPARSTSGRQFDLVLLGMGDNGHTASLFPGNTAVRETTRWVVADYIEAVAMWRVTLTPVVINAAAEVMFLVTGGEKAGMLRRVLEGPYQPELLPAQVVGIRGNRPRWLVDRAAALELDVEARGG